MNSLGNIKWLQCNNIIYKIYTSQAGEKMYRNLLDLMTVMLDADAAAIITADKKEPVSLVVSKGLGDDFSELYRDRLFDQDFKKLFCLAAKNREIRSSQVYSDEDWEKQPVCREAYIKNGVFYEDAGIMSYDGKFMGMLIFLRSRDKGDFNVEESFFVDVLKSHLAYRLYSDQYIKHEARPETENSYPVPDMGRYVRFGLTKREMEVLGLMIRDISNTEICETLCITANTLKKHITKIYSKLGVRNRRELHRMNIDMG